MQKWKAAEEQYRAWLLPSGRGVVSYADLADDPASVKVHISAPDGRTLWEGTVPVEGEAILADIDASATLLAVSLDWRTLRVFGVDGAPTQQSMSATDEAAIGELQLSHDGHWLAVLRTEGTLSLYDTRKLDQPKVVITMLPDGRLAADPDLKTIVVANGTSVKVWREEAVDTIEFPVPSPPGNAPAGEMNRPAVSGTGRIAFTFGNHPAILVHEADGRPALEPLRGGASPSVAFLRNGTDLIAGDFVQSTVRVFDTGPRALRELVAHGPVGADRTYEATSSFAFCPQRGALAWGGLDGTLRVLETDGSLAEFPNWHGDRVQSIVCTSSKEIVTGDIGGSELKVLPAHGSPLTVDLSGRETAKIAAIGNGGRIARIGGGRTVRVWRLEPFGEVAEFAPGDETGGALGYVTGIAGIPGSDDIIVTGQRQAGSGAMFASRWQVGERPRLLWKTELPDLFDIWTVKASPDGETVWVAGPFDRAYALDRNGALSDNLESVLRPAAYSLAYAASDLFAASSFQGEVALLTDRERLAALPGTLPPPVPLAADTSGKRVFIADGTGRIAEIALNPDALVRIGCAKLELKPEVCADRGS